MPTVSPRSGPRRLRTSPNRSVALEWATFIMAMIAAVGSVVRVAQNERSYRLMLRMYKKAKKKKKK
jgi:hypothetical protein